KTMERFDQTIGLDKLQVFHLNDSKREWGSRVDRHEHIGRGKIGESGFGWILNDERLIGVPKILETPKGKTHREDKRNLKLLRSLVKRG
ncbi:MAG: TIM barrel protein, partial [Acidobacteriota bacterium]